MQKIIQWIWLNAWMREGILIVASVLAVTVGLSLVELSTALEDTAAAPLDDIKTWASATGIAVLVTVVKQTAAILLTHFGKVVTVKAQESTPPA